MIRIIVLDDDTGAVRQALLNAELRRYGIALVGAEKDAQFWRDCEALADLIATPGKRETKAYVLRSKDPLESEMCRTDGSRGRRGKGERRRNRADRWR